MNWEYITGFFDADGSVTIAKVTKSRERSPQISFHNNELDILIAMKDFIFKELSIKGFISKKKKVKEHHGQQYELKYVNFPKCIAISDKMNTIHPKKKVRFELIKKLYSLTPRNGKYTEEMLTKRTLLESKFFE